MNAKAKRGRARVRGWLTDAIGDSDEEACHILQAGLLWSLREKVSLPQLLQRVAVAKAVMLDASAKRAGKVKL